jgi:hypothetical protein
MRALLRLLGIGAIALLGIPAALIAHAISPNTVTNCDQISQFAHATTATPPIGFPDVSFPTHSVSVTNGQTHDVYTYQITSVCTNSSTVSAVVSFYKSYLPAHGWASSSTYPYKANPAASCGTSICWRKNGPPKRYVSLQGVVQNGSVVTYALWTAIAPKPSFTINRRSTSLTIGPSTNGSIGVACASGEQMLGGGYTLSDHSRSPYASYPSAINVWRVNARSGATSLTIGVYAMCLAANFPIQAQIHTLTGDVSGYLDVSCPSGTTATGGGFSIAIGSQIDEMIQQGSFWEMQATPSGTGTAYAICAIGMVHEPNATAYFNDSGDQTRTVSCPSGFTLIGGGFHYGAYPFPWYQDYPYPDAAHWTVSAVESASMEPPTANGSCDWFNPF